MLNDHYLEGGCTPEIRKAYVDGVIDGIFIEGGGCVLDEEEARMSFVRGKIAKYKQTVNEYVRAGARKLIEQRQFVDEEVRGMLFNVYKMTENGEARNESGSTHPKQTYPICAIRHRETNTEISATVYEKLPEDAKTNYRKVKYFRAGYTRVFETDFDFIAEFIVQDFLRNPGLKVFYEEALNPGGELERYKDAVEAAKRDHGWEITELEHCLSRHA